MLIVQKIYSRQNVKMKKVFFEFILSLAWAVSVLPAFEITENTQIVISQDACESTQLAAEEIADYMQKSCWIKPTIVRGNSNASSQIFIGTLSNIKNLPPDVAKKLQDAKSPDAFAIVCRGNTLIIAGKDRVGELYGTYAFLEEKLGIRWFRAATKYDSYEYVPHHPRLQLEDFMIIRDPVFRFRMLTHSGATGRIPVNGQTLAVRQGFQINPPWNYKRAFQEKFYQARCSMLAVSEGGHGAFSTPVSKDLYDQHPEYFALQNGKRVKGLQICISNPDVQLLVQKYIENIYKSVPVGNITWLFGMLDATTGWCECAGCRELDKAGKFDHINISTRFHKVVTKIMAEIYKKYPEAMLEAWAYHTYRSIPENVKYDPRALIYYCTHGRCYGHSLSDSSCRRNTVQFDLIKAWRKISSRMKVYEYANCTPVFYGCMEEILAKDLRLYRKLGLEGWKEEMSFADAQFYPPVKKGEVDYRSDRANSNWQWYCVAGKLLWNPELDPEEILADVESKYYGKAYPAMKKYHDLRRKLWNNSSYCFGYPTGDQRREALLSAPGAKEKLLALLDEAERLAADDDILKKRLQDDREWLQRYWSKPNASFRKKQLKTATVPRVEGTLYIDGDPSDTEWFRAWHTSDFRYLTGKNKGKKAGGKNKIFLSVLHGENVLYLRLHSAGRWKSGDYTVFYIIPLDEPHICFALAVNADGTYRHEYLPEKYKKISGLVITAAKNDKNGYVMEARISLAGIGVPRNGSLWKVHAIKYNPQGAYSSLDGIAADDKNNYRDFVMGTPLLRNGTFEVLNENGTPTNWTMNKGRILKHRFSHAVKLEYGNYIYQLLAGGELAQQPSARKIRIILNASGSGVLKVYAMRYSDTPDGKAKYRYTRKFISTQEIGHIYLFSPQQRAYICDYTIRPDEWIGLRFVSTGGKNSFVVLDNISIVNAPK